MIEITSCGPCGANLIRWDRESVWTNSQTGQFYCPESATRRHHKNPDVGIVELPPEALAPMLVGVPWIDDVPIANAGYLGPDLSSDEGIDLWPMDVDTFIRRYGPDPYQTRRPEPPGPTFAHCCICGMILQPLHPPQLMRKLGTRWVDASGYGATCLGGQAHKVGRIHGVSGKITTDEESVEHGRCSGCGEAVTRVADGLWRNRDGFLACAPPPAPETARHGPVPDLASCRWCRKPIRIKARDASGAAVWHRDGIGVDEPQLAFELCEMAPDDTMPHMPAPAVYATMPVNGEDQPNGNPGATIHMPGDRRYTLTPMETVALIRELAMTTGETHRLAARLLMREMMPNGQIFPQWEDLLDALGLLDIIPKNLDPRLSADGTAAQVWAGSFMVAEMDRDEILTHVRALLDILASLKDEETSGD